MLRVDIKFFFKIHKLLTNLDSIVPDEYHYDENGKIIPQGELIDNTLWDSPYSRTCAPLRSTKVGFERLYLVDI